jgi:hypothetical protein
VARPHVSADAPSHDLPPRRGAPSRKYSHSKWYSHSKYRRAARLLALHLRGQSQARIQTPPHYPFPSPTPNLPLTYPPPTPNLPPAHTFSFTYSTLTHTTFGRVEHWPPWSHRGNSPNRGCPLAGDYAAGEEGRLQYLARRAIWDRDLGLQAKRVQAEFKEATAVRRGAKEAASGVSSSLSAGTPAEGARALDPQPARSLVGPDAPYHKPRADGTATTIAPTRRGLWPWPATLLSRRRLARTQKLRNSEVLAAAQVSQRKAAAARATASSPTKYSTAAAECVRADSFSSDSSSLDT